MSTADSKLEETLKNAQEKLQEFQSLIEGFRSEWVSKKEVAELRKQLCSVELERDAWKMRFEALQSSLRESGGFSSNESPLSPFTLEMCDHVNCKRQPIPCGHIVSEPLTTNFSTLKWNVRPRTVFIKKKPNKPSISRVLAEVACFLVREQGMTVYVEEETKNELIAMNFEANFLQTWNFGASIDFVVALGGDGTLLFLSTLFPHAVPPVIAFAMGSLGFLTMFEIEYYKQALTTFINDGGALSLRTRLTCKVIKSTGQVVVSEVVVNEVVVDRGTSSQLTNLDCFVDDIYCTTVQADGAILCTPTGSTAYSLSAGGSMCHPQVPCIILTPISPHSLSFRPVIFQHSVHFKIILSQHSRGNAWVSFDGHNRTMLDKGDAVTVTLSRYPLPLVCANNETADWLRAVTSCLRWNLRGLQNPADVDEERLLKLSSSSLAGSTSLEEFELIRKLSHQMQKTMLERQFIPTEMKSKVKGKGRVLLLESPSSRSPPDNPGSKFATQHEDTDLLTD